MKWQHARDMAPPGGHFYLVLRDGETTPVTMFLITGKDFNRDYQWTGPIPTPSPIPLLGRGYRKSLWQFAKSPVFVGRNNRGEIKFMTLARGRRGSVLIESDRDGDLLKHSSEYAAIFTNSILDTDVLEVLNGSGSYQWDILPEHGKWSFGFFSRQSTHQGHGSIYSRPNGEEVAVTCVADDPTYCAAPNAPYKWEDTRYVGVVTDWKRKL